MIRPDEPAPARAAPPAAVLLWAAPVAWAAVLFLLSSVPAQALPAGPGGVDKLVHAGSYAVLALLILRALARGRWRGVTGRIALASVLAAAGYGLTDEWHQRYVPGRQFDLVDLAADAAGAALAAAWARHRARRAGRM